MFTFCGSLDLVVCVYIRIAPKGQAGLFQPNRIYCSELPWRVIWTPMRVIEATFSYSQLSQSSISGGRSLVQQIHNLCNLKNTCDHESKWEWETQKHWGSLWWCQFFCFGEKRIEVKCWASALPNTANRNNAVLPLRGQSRAGSDDTPLQNRSNQSLLQLFFSQTILPYFRDNCFLYYPCNVLVHWTTGMSSLLFNIE